MSASGEHGSPSDTGAPSPSRRPILWLFAGAVSGVALAASGLLHDAGPERGLDARIAARVNDSVILRENHERLVAGLESDTKSAADAKTRRRVLDRMIDEELLVQRGLELGLAKTDRKIRGDLTTAVIRAIVVEAEARQPTRDELEAFFEQERAFFTQPGRLRVAQIFFRVRDASEHDAAAARAEAAFARLSGGEGFDAVREEFGDSVISPLPDTLLPAAKLREYLGPTTTQAAAALEVGVASRPIRSGIGFHILRVSDREDARTPTFDAFEPQIRSEWTRQAGDEALRSYLDDLRGRADVVISEP